MRMQEAPAVRPGAAIATAPATAAAKEDRRQRGGVFPSDARAIIQCTSRSVLSGGRARANEWVLSFEPRTPPFIEPLMGWTGSTDPLPQIRLRFSSRDAAIRYAERQGLHYEVRGPVQFALHGPAFAQAGGDIPEPVARACDKPHPIPGQFALDNDNAGEPANEDCPDRAAV